MNEAVPTRTAHGVPLAPDERVVFTHTPPPISDGERAGIFFIGLIFLPILVGIFLMIYAFTKKADRAWFITNQRIVNVKPDGKVRAIKLENIRVAAKKTDTIEMGHGDGTVSVPLTAQIHGKHMLDAIQKPMAFADLPSVDAPA